MSKTIAKVAAIGPHALDPEDPLVILFGDTATPALRDVAVIQVFASAEAQQALTLVVGDAVEIDGARFAIRRVGALANQNLQTIGHVSLIFTDIPAQPMENALYLTPTAKPQLHVDSTIAYITA